jgi:U3 small nucleolar RNA-associated protein 4
MFSLRPRKGDERNILKIQKVDVASEISADGARIVSISPDLRWLSIVRPNSEIWLARIFPSSEKEKPRLHPKLVHAERAPRHTRYEKVSHGTLGNYERTIRSIGFSDDSKILASGDLSGCVDVWVLEDVSTSGSQDSAKKTDGVTSSDDESSDDEDEQPIIEGQRWKPNPNESPIPRLPSGIVFVSFRPRGQVKTQALTNGNVNGSSSIGGVDDRLMVLTSEHHLIEFEALKGTFSEWSRRNPKAYLPAEFTGVKDRAMGGLWDVSEGRERLWLYGTSWLWMFDLTHDFPSPGTDSTDGPNTSNSGQLVKATPQKRKRTLEDEDQEERRKYNSGAGDRIPMSQADVSLGIKIRKVVGHDESKEEWIQVDEPRRQRSANDDNDEDDFGHEDPFFGNDHSNFARLRRGEKNPDSQDGGLTPYKRLTNGVHADDNKIFPDGEEDGTSFAVVVDNTLNGDDHHTPSKKNNQNEGNGPSSSSSSQPSRQWWHTYKYRDILGIVPLLSHHSPEKNAVGKESTSTSLLEVAVVERPMWDMDLPGRYVRDYE